MSKVFISHASADASLLEEFVSLLTGGIGLPLAEVFCSSLDGLGISSGQDIPDTIAQAIRAADVCILILSPNYYASMYCLAEMGAIWIINKNVFLIRTNTLQHPDPGVFFPGRKSVLFDRSGLAQVYDLLKDMPDFTAAPVERWQVKLDIFMDNLVEIIKALPLPSIIDPTEHAKIAQKNSALLDIIKEVEKRNKELELINSELRQAKNKEEVAAIINKHLTTDQKYEKLLADIKKHVALLPKIVKDALFIGVRGEYLSADRNNMDDIKIAERRELLRFSHDADGQGYVANSEHPQIIKAEKAIANLRKFLRSAPELEEALTEQLGYPAQLKNEDYWDKITSFGY